MKASKLFLPALLLLGISTAATAQTQPGNTSTVGGGASGTQMQSGTTTRPSTMQNGASIGNNRDVMSSGTGTTPAGTMSGQSSMSGHNGGKRAMHKDKGTKMKSKSSDMQ